MSASEPRPRPAKNSSALSYLPLILAFGIGFIADKSPEFLPIFRGLRVMLGAVVGFVIGTLLLAVMNAFSRNRSPA